MAHSDARRANGVDGERIGQNTSSPDEMDGEKAKTNEDQRACAAQALPGREFQLGIP